MSQNDLSIANQGFASFRSDLNSALQALGSTNSGTSAPSTTYANQLFYDTTNNILKIRNEDNDAFINLITLDQTNDKAQFDLDGTELILDADGDTSITADTDDQIDIRVGGSDQIKIATGEVAFNEASGDVDFRVESNGLTNAFMVDGGNNGIGFGHSPRSDLHTAWTQSFFGTEGSIISQVNSGGGIAGMSVTQNTYVDSDTGGYAYMTTNEATKLDLKDGVTSFSRAASGTAGNAITFSESMRIDSDGHVGIGTTDPQTGLHLEASDGSVNGTIRLTATGVASSGMAMDANGLNFGADTGGFLFKTGATANDPSDTGTERMRIDSNGDVGIGSTTPGGLRLFVTKAQSTGNNVAQFTNSTSSGNVFCVGTSINSNGNNTSSFHVRSVTQGVLTAGLLGNGTQTFTSDERLKKNIETTRDGYLEDLAKLRVVKYNWHNHEDGTPKELGLIAQEVEKVFPNLIRTDDDLDLNGVTDPKSLKASVIPMMLLKGLQEATKRIETLEAKVTALEGK